ncbi:hypothetical protein B9Z55_014194 [Caenorhabditis nigoni]|uniref:Uncharacterized protein n=2 Tax=Caenorhabditis nigoni TaxID=1611254 RepID=A0A2G5U4Y7_9PELO|nr:hypothetical protein B9Z55_014194 [Caenorhabditis nigoni]
MHRIFFDSHNKMSRDRIINEDYPNVAPFLAVENFVSFPVYSPTFCFSTSAISNILFMQEIKIIIARLDDLISRNKLNQHPCLISQAGAQATMRLASKSKLRNDWGTTVEMPFCLHVTENGSCPRVFDDDDLHEQAKWLKILEEVILPLDKMKESELATIAPHQHSAIVKNAMTKLKKEQKPKSYSKSISETDSSSSHEGSL